MDCYGYILDYKPPLEICQICIIGDFIEPFHIWSIEDTPIAYPLNLSPTLEELDEQQKGYTIDPETGNYIIRVD